MSEGSLLDDMENYFDQRGQEQDAYSGVSVIRPTKQDNNANLELFYKKLEELGMNLDELKPILECDDNLLVLSGAGSGKTTALILKIIRDLISGDMMKAVTTNSVYGQTTVQVPANILISTFLKTGALELQQSLRDWCQKLGLVGIDYTNINFKTIHAEVLDALKQMGVPVNIIQETNTMVRAVMNKYSIRNVSATSRSLTVDEISDMQLMVAYARNRLDDERYNHPLMGDYRMDAVLLDAVLNDLKLQRRASGGMDFEDMQEMLLEALQMNPKVQEHIANRYDFVYVDEFQDTSQLQYELLKYYFNGAKRKITIGDDDQSIYSWRGGDNEIIGSKFANDYEPTILKLTTNYRCKANILNPVIPSIEKNPNRHDKRLRAHSEGGEVNVIMNGNVNQMINSMKLDLSNNMNVGILARTNADLLIPAMILELDGNVNYGLSKSVNMHGRMARQVFGIMDLITKRVNKDFEGYFRMFLPRYNWYEAEKLYNVLTTNKSMNIYSIPFEDIQHSVPKLAPFIKGLRDAKALGGVEAYLFLLGVMESQSFQGKSLYAKKARDLVQFVKQIVLEHNSVKDLDIHKIDNLFNQVIPERLQRRVKYGKDTFVKLTTVHEAKGKEWDSVYIWNNVEGAFPNQVGNREMTDLEFEEERRVHYIAWTRAKSKLTVYSDQSNPGSFLLECDLSQVKTHIEEPKADMSKVFKKAEQPLSSEIQTDTLLRSYISKVHENGGLTDEKVANVEIVLNNHSQEELVERLESEYGVHLSQNPQEQSDLLDLFFKSLSDEIFNKGNYNA